VFIVIFLAYCTLFAELIFLHVPSVASVYQLIFSKKSIVNFSKEQLPHASRLYGVLNWPLTRKLLLLALPTFISIITGLLPLLFLGLIYFGVCNWHQLNNVSFVQNCIGIILILAGRVLTIFSTFLIRKKNRQQMDSFDLKTDGAFAFSRNPLLLGMYIMYAGMFVTFPVFIFGIGLSVYFANMHFRVLLEEDFLQQQFGDSFSKYKKKTKRYC
jgi:protein-S-isoprenylcysteine O-methyltransferase Ste14